jgi:hypothetical protein
LALTPQITARDRLTEGRTAISCGLLLSFICAHPPNVEAFVTNFAGEDTTMVRSRNLGSIPERGIHMYERLGRALLFLLAIIMITQPDDASTKRALVVQNIQDYRAAYPNEADPDARTVITMVSGARYGVRETMEQITTLIRDEK